MIFSKGYTGYKIQTCSDVGQIRVERAAFPALSSFICKTITALISGIMTSANITMDLKAGAFSATVNPQIPATYPINGPVRIKPNRNVRLVRELIMAHISPCT